MRHVDSFLSSQLSLSLSLPGCLFVPIAGSIIATRNWVCVVRLQQIWPNGQKKEKIIINSHILGGYAINMIALHNAKRYVIVRVYNSTIKVFFFLCHTFYNVFGIEILVQIYNLTNEPKKKNYERRHANALGVYIMRIYHAVFVGVVVYR